PLHDGLPTSRPDADTRVARWTGRAAYLGGRRRAAPSPLRADRPPGGGRRGLRGLEQVACALHRSRRLADRSAGGLATRESGRLRRRAVTTEVAGALGRLSPPRRACVCTACRSPRAAAAPRTPPSAGICSGQGGTG